MILTRRVLITGIGGFAGGFLAAHLAGAGYEVTGLLNKGGVSVPGMTKAFFTDLRDLNQVRETIALANPTHVVHLAAISFVGHGDAREIYETNVVGTRNLLVALAELKYKPEAVLLTSSANVYGNSDKGELTEADEIHPTNDYAVSKIAMEYMARQFFSRLNIIIARPFNYTGRGQSVNFLVPKIVNHFREGADVIELGNIDVARDFSDVRTVTQIFHALLETPVAIGEVYNICSGKPYSLSYIIETCARLTGHNLNIRVNPDFVRANEIKTLIGRPDKLNRDVGEFEACPFEETLKWMLGA
jgi:nucleoside-diphosphate-sugar epimerase